MEQEIVNAITKTLGENYGDDYEYHSDSDIEQGLQEPCFFVKRVDGSQTPYPNQRKFREYQFDILYFPQDRNNNAEMSEVKENLFELLENLELINGNKIRGTSMKGFIENGVLHFLVNYNTFIKVVFTETEMGTLTTNADTQ